jgi:hypothetical protein
MNLKRVTLPAAVAAAVCATTVAVASAAAIPTTQPAAVNVRVLSEQGPVAPRGPFFGTTVATVRKQVSASECDGSVCWPDAPTKLKGDLIIAAKVQVNGCYKVTALHATVGGATLQVNATTALGCPRGALMAAQSREWLFGVPLTSLPGSGTLTIKIHSGPAPSSFDLHGTFKLP